MDASCYVAHAPVRASRHLPVRQHGSHQPLHRRLRVVHEDDQLGTRFGAFDWDPFWSRAQAYTANQPDPSGSTIPQQLVKNIYPWPAHDWLRKGIEAGLSEEVATYVPKPRIVELYLNYAQFGPKLYGVCAAS